jgi:hypothetical protein
MPRKSDGLIWDRSNVANDDAHPSVSGQQKAAEQLLTFFKKTTQTRELGSFGLETSKKVCR